MNKDIFKYVKISSNTVYIEIFAPFYFRKTGLIE